MSDLVLLGAFALLTGAAGPELLRRQRWFDQSPRLGVVLWLAGLWSTITASFLVIALIALDSAPVSDLVVGVIRACITTFHHHYGTHPVAAGIALAGIAAAATGLVLQGTRIWYRISRVRRRHHRILDLVARPHTEPGVWVIDHPTPTAYCLPGRGGRIVVSSGALGQLTTAEIGAVIAHERAHLSGRHHDLVACLYACSTLVPFLPVARRAPFAVGCLLERLADDKACRRQSPHVLAAALRTMSPCQTPLAALSITGGSTASRIHRLASEPQPASRTRRALAWTLATAFVVLPFILAVSPVLGIAFADQCTLPAPV